MSTVGALQKKARSADTWIRSKVDWWPTKEQSAKAAKKVKKKINSSDISVTGTVGEALKKVAEGPMRALNPKR